MTAACTPSDLPLLVRVENLENDAVNRNSLAENRFDVVVARLNQLETVLGLNDPTAPQPAPPAPPSVRPMTATEAGANRAPGL